MRIGRVIRKLHRAQKDLNFICHETDRCVFCFSTIEECCELLPQILQVYEEEYYICGHCYKNIVNK